MSKLVNWGRWLVAASMGFYIAMGIYDDTLHVLASAHAGHDWIYLLGIAARYSILVALFAAVGWGILNWADWAHGLLTLLMTFGVGIVLYALFIGGRQALNWEVLGSLALYSSTLMWLLIPAVRHTYWQKEKNAMSWLINWGHWLSAAFFAFVGADLLWSAIIRVPVLIREHPQEITYHFVSDAFFWMPMLLCAWGIFKWRLWSRKLGTVLSILSLAMLGILVSIEFQHAGPYRGGLLALALINCSVFVWLLLPVVRAEYLRRDQIA